MNILLILNMEFLRGKMRFTLLAIIVSCFILGGALALFHYSPDLRTAHITTKGKPLIGGPFQLTTHKGENVSEKSFQKYFKLIYFGYSYCPDVCPGDLQVISSAMDLLNNKAHKVQPLFITVDPDRDTVEQLSGYVPHFHKRIIGLTGTQDQIKKVTKAYRVFYSRVEVEDSNLEYLMNHSSIIYFMDKNGDYITHFSHGVSPEKISETISKYL